VGVLIQKENEAPLGPKAKGEENGKEASLLINSGVWESVMSSPSGFGAEPQPEIVSL